jgi:hypothetical protein
MEAEKEENVLVRVLEALENGNLILSFHAMEQMQAREVTFFEVKEALYQGQREENKDDYRQNSKGKKWSWRYSIRGLVNNGEKDLRIIIALTDPKTVVVTVIDLNRKD